MTLREIVRLFFYCALADLFRAWDRVRPSTRTVFCLIDGSQIFIGGALVGQLVTEGYKRWAAAWLLITVGYFVGLYRDSRIGE
jgi:hypothetical protein